MPCKSLQLIYFSHIYLFHWNDFILSRMSATLINFLWGIFLIGFRQAYCIEWITSPLFCEFGACKYARTKRGIYLTWTYLIKMISGSVRGFLLVIGELNDLRISKRLHILSRFHVRFQWIVWNCPISYFWQYLPFCVPTDFI